MIISRKFNHYCKIISVQNELLLDIKGDIHLLKSSSVVPIQINEKIKKIINIKENEYLALSEEGTLYY